MLTEQQSNSGVCRTAFRDISINHIVMSTAKLSATDKLSKLSSYRVRSLLPDLRMSYPILRYSQTTIRASAHSGAGAGRYISNSQIPVCHLYSLAQNRPSKRLLIIGPWLVV